MSDQKWKHIHNKIVPMVCVVALLLAEPVNAMSNVISISTNDIHSGVIIENGISENGINENEMQPDGNGANEIEPEKISGNELDIDDPNADGISGNELSAPAGVSANELPEENNLSDQIEFNEMELTPQMVSEKQALSMHLDEYEEMVPSCDYVENQAVFLSDSLEEAQKIAECYQAELKQYAYGVAVIQSDATAKAMVTAAADLDQKLPPVYYNGIVTMDEVPAGELSMDEVPINEVPADELSANQIGPCAEQWFHDYIGSKESWEYTDGSDILVAVIDTGVRYTHLDLIDNCVDGYDFVNEDSDPMDDQGHGTHVAGTIAGISSNEIGGCGVAPNSKIMPLKVLSSTGKGSTANVMTAVEYAVEHQADIINLSLGSSFYSEVFQEVINHAVTQGVVVVGAAGNDGSEHMHYPAAYEGTISVASLLDTTENMGLRDASNYGSWVDIAAPGTNIYATVFTSDTAYGYKNGTSMACPVVAGTIALMMDADPSLKGSTVKTVKQIDSLLKNTEHRIRYYNSTGGSVYGGVYAGGATGIRYYQKISSPVFLPSEILDQKKNIIAAGEEDCYLTITSLPGSRVYYTTNGKIPTDNSTLYTGPIPMKQSGKLTIKAIAYVGKRKSAVATKTYQLNAKAVKVEFYGGTQYHVARGKNIRLSPVFTPTYTTSKSLTYQSSNPAIRVNAAGVVSCKANTAPGTAAVISATTKDGSGLSISTNVIVVDQATKTLTLNAKEVKLSAYPTDEFAAGDLENEFRLIPSVTNDQSTGFLYTTSNKKVATVDAAGLIKAVGKGTAIITVKANDGSAKQKICRVKVVMPVYQIHTIKTSTGFNDSYLNVPIGCGNSIRLTAYQNENYKCVTGGTYDRRYIASDARVIWSSNSPYLIVNKTTGTVKCRKDAPIGATALITVRARDGYGASQSMLFKIEPKVKKIASSLTKEQRSLILGQVSSSSLTKEEIIDSCEVNTYSYGNVTLTTQVVHNHVIDFLYQSDIGKYLLCGTRPGTAKIRISDANGSGKACTITFHVKEVP